MTSIADRIRRYILDEHLPDTPAEELRDDVELFDNGILDSMSVLRLRAFLEQEYDLAIASHELDFDDFGTIADIARLVQSKLAA